MSPKDFVDAKPQKLVKFLEWVVLGKKNDVQQQISKAWTYLYFGVLRKYLNFCINYDKGMLILVVGLTFKYYKFKYLILD